MATTTALVSRDTTQVTRTSSNADYHLNLAEGHGRVAEYRTEAEMKSAYSTIRERLNPSKPIPLKVNITEIEATPAAQVVVINHAPPPPPAVYLPPIVPGLTDLVPMRIFLQDIVELVVREYGVSRTELQSPRRNDTIVKARQIAMWLAYKTTSLSYPQIGNFFHRDHSTVHHACHRVEERLGAVDVAWRELLVERLKEQATMRRNALNVVGSDSVTPDIGGSHL